MIMESCQNCEATIPRGIRIGTPSGKKMTVVTNYCAVCGEKTPWGEEYTNEER